MQLDDLRAHLRRGGAATLNHPATYGVAEGAIVAPARYGAGGPGALGRAARQGSEFVFETRFVEGEFRRTALIDSKQSQANRAEEGLLASRRSGSRAREIPVIEVAYEGRPPLTDMELPHRAFDAHIRFATQEGDPVIERPWYRALRDAAAADLSPIFVVSPTSIAFGSWDSSRKTGQVRLRGLYVSELFGVVAAVDRPESRRSGARLDPLGQDFNVSPDELTVLLNRQREELSEKLVDELEKSIANARKKGQGVSAAKLNLGGIPPSTETPFGVAVPKVHRARTVSLAGLRRLRFGGSEDEDAAARAALLALLLVGAAYADADPTLRAYCDVSAPDAATALDDELVELDLSIDACEAFLSDALDGLPERLAWSGQVQRVEGDPALNRGARAEAADGE